MHRFPTVFQMQSQAHHGKTPVHQHQVSAAPPVLLLQVQFFGAVTKQTPYMIITELMHGGSLADMFREAEFPDMRRAVELCLHCARGMNYLHNRSPHVSSAAASRCH